MPGVVQCPIQDRSITVSLSVNCPALFLGLNGLVILENGWKIIVQDGSFVQCLPLLASIPLYYSL